MSHMKTKELVTVHAVREANTRLISRTPLSGRYTQLTGRPFRLTSAEIAAAGAVAMRTLSTPHKK